MNEFVKGMDLCETFFLEIAAPVLREHFPNLKYTAGLIGYGSDVLGYDDITSIDHMWGPRFYLFLQDEDIHLKADIISFFSTNFPYVYKGYSVNFTTPSADNPIRVPELIENGKVNPLIFIHTADEYLNSYLGKSDLDNLDTLDWLSFSENRLLSLKSGKLFVDMLNLKDRLKSISYYPEKVWLYLIASNWSIISEEQAFVKRCSDVGDEIGSMIICARIMQRLIRLAFLYQKEYAPYAKWFGTAFSKLAVDEELKTLIFDALKANEINEREEKLVLAQKKLADIHNSLKITKHIDVSITNYHDREIKVINADNIAGATCEVLEQSEFSDFPLIGKLCQVSNLVAFTDDPTYKNNLKAMYQK